MRLLLSRNLWGLEDDPARYGRALADVAAAGYDAVSCPVQALPDGDAFAAMLADSRLEYVPQLFTFGRTVEEHLQSLRDGLVRAAPFSPRHVVAQSGRDHWAFGEAVAFFRQALDMAAELGLTVAHETHRGRILYAPWVAQRVLAEVPGLPLSCDLSHWTCVAESMRIHDAVLHVVAGAAIHVDARVGFEEGPQVPDPREERYAAHLQAFEGWWDTVWEARRSAGAEALVMAPEFGPPPYQPIHPATGEPLADVNQLNDWMATRLRRRYGGNDSPGPA